MAEFLDEFVRADEAIETGNNWQALDDTNDSSNVIRVGNARAVTNVIANATVAWYIATVPTTSSQEVGGHVISATQGSNIYVDLGVMGSPTATWGATNPTGVWARLSWLASGARRLAIHRSLPGDTAGASVRSLDLVTAGSIPADGYEGVLSRNGEVGERQWLRLIVTSVDGGLLARAYLNQGDDDRPTLTATIDRDLLDTGVVDMEFGTWWLGFGDGSAAVGDVAVLGIYGLDYLVDDDHQPQERRSDQPTLAVARERVRRHYESSTNTALLDPVLDDAITDTIEDLINLCGDQCWFLVREEAVTITPDTDGVATLLPKMRRIHEIRYPPNNRKVRYAFMYDTDEGAPVVQMPTTLTASYTVRYTLRHAQVVNPTDLLPIPREYLEALTIGACQKLARRDRKGALAAEFSREYERLTMTMMRDLARRRNMARTSFTAARIPFGYFA